MPPFLAPPVSTETLEIEIQPAILLTGNTAFGTANQVTETFTIAAAQQEITLAAEPSATTVFLNGLLITDFTIVGSTLTFDCLDEGDFLVVKYL